MSLKTYFDRVFTHRAWANRRTFGAMLDCPAAQAEATPLFAHVLAAEHVWLSRLLGRTPALAIWPTLTLDECRTTLDENDAEYARYLASLTDEMLHFEIDYQDSRGAPFRNTVADVLTQVFMHGQYHRGQIAKLVGRAGGTTPFTDFIVFVRESGASEKGSSG